MLHPEAQASYGPRVACGTTCAGVCGSACGTTCGTRCGLYIPESGSRCDIGVGQTAGALPDPTGKLSCSQPHRAGGILPEQRPFTDIAARDRDAPVPCLRHDRPLTDAGGGR